MIFGGACAAACFGHAQVSEAGEAAKLPGGGLDAVLARAEAALRDGRLAAAANALEQAAGGTAAAPAAGKWARGARARAAADQAAALLQVQLPALLAILMRRMSPGLSYVQVPGICI